MVKILLFNKMVLLPTRNAEKPGHLIDKSLSMMSKVRFEISPSIEFTPECLVIGALSQMLTCSIDLMLWVVDPTVVVKMGPTFDHQSKR
jgi:hypothetical protein